MISNCIYKGRIITVQKKRVKLPNGNTVFLDSIHHPGASAIVPVLNDGRIVLIRQYHFNIGDYIYQLPAGTLNRGEKPLACAKRELLEEAGYSAKRWKKLLSVRITPSFSDETIHIFEARDLKLEETAHEEDEVISVEIFTKKQIMKMLETGKFVDAKTICALYRSLY